jgi:hypothetical protein
MGTDIKNKGHAHSALNCIQVLVEELVKIFAAEFDSGGMTPGLNVDWHGREQAALQGS